MQPPSFQTARRSLPEPVYRTQLDGSRYARSNCGPASLGMVLDAYGVQLSTLELRQLTHTLQGNWPGGEQKPFRLVLVGSASFATNAFFPYASNGDLAVSMIRWLADDRATPKLKPATYSTAEVRLTHREMQLTFFLIEILLPLSVIGFGVAMWRRRR